MRLNFITVSVYSVTKLSVFRRWCVGGRLGTSSGRISARTERESHVPNGDRLLPSGCTISDGRLLLSLLEAAETLSVCLG